MLEPRAASGFLAPEQQLRKRVAALDTAEGAMAHILVIDDDEGILVVLRQALENAGHRVSVAGNGVAGIEQVQQQQDEVDLVICDLFMPVKDGFDTLRELRALRPDLPVIIMSGRFQSGPRAAAEQVDYLHITSELGASGTLQKPFRLPDLVDMVAGILAGNRGKL